MFEILRKQFETLVELNDEEFELIKSHFTEKVYAKNDFIFKEGDYVENCFFVTTGILKQVFVNDNGKEFIFSIVTDNRWETDFVAFFTNIKTKMYLRCVEKTHLFCLSIDNYHKMCKEIPKMQIFFQQKSTLGFITTQQRLLSFLTMNIQERYEIVLKNQFDLCNRISKTLLASYLGVSRETLSRLHPKK